MHCGCWVAGNTGGLVHGGRSERVLQAMLPEQADIQASMAAWRQEILTDLGGDAETSRVQRDLLDTYLQVSALVTFLGTHVVAQGPLTPRGKTAARFNAFLAAADRQQRLAQALGLERRSKTVPTLSDYMARRPGGDAA
jgi:hypothetical protein